MKTLIMIQNFMLDRRGSNMGEYVAIGALILMAAAGAVGALGGKLTGVLESIAGAI